MASSDGLVGSSAAASRAAGILPSLPQSSIFGCPAERRRRQLLPARQQLLQARTAVAAGKECDRVLLLTVKAKRRWHVMKQALCNSSGQIAARSGCIIRFSGPADIRLVFVVRTAASMVGGSSSFTGKGEAVKDDAEGERRVLGIHGSQWLTRVLFESP